MVRVEKTITVNRPVDEVFGYLTDLDRIPEWQSSLTEMRQESEGPMAVGTRLVETRKFLGRRMDSTLEVTEYEPGRRWALRVIDGPVPYRVEHTLEPANGGTRLAWVAEGEPGRFFRFAEPLVARQAERQFGADWETFKEIVEGGP